MSRQASTLAYYLYPMLCTRSSRAGWIFSLASAANSWWFRVPASVVAVNGETVAREGRVQVGGRWNRPEALATLQATVERENRHSHKPFTSWYESGGNGP